MRPPPSSTLFPYTTLFRSIAAADYFDRLALDRARDVIGDAERKLTMAVLADGSSGASAVDAWAAKRSEEHTSELQSQFHLVCRLLREQKNRSSSRERPAAS